MHDDVRRRSSSWPGARRRPRSRSSRRCSAAPATSRASPSATPTDDTTIDDDGAVRSIQGADIVPLRRALRRAVDDRRRSSAWRAPTGRYLSHVTLGLIRVYYTEASATSACSSGRSSCSTFQAPEYETDADRGIVRWRIDKGLLVASRGRGGDGYLEIDVRRLDCDERRPGAHPRRGRGRELLPGDRLTPRARSLHQHAVADPRDRHPRLPAPPGAARPRRVGDRAHVPACPTRERARRQPRANRAPGQAQP